MEQPGSQKNAFQLLDEFEMLENIQASHQWEKELFAKLGNADPVYYKKKNGLKSALLIGCFVLINAVSLIKLSAPTGSQEEKRNEVLQSISAELLINSTALK